MQETNWIANVAKPFTIEKSDKIMLFYMKEQRKKNPSNYNDPKTMSTRNQKDWPTGKANGNYKLNLSYWYQPDHIRLEKKGK